MLGTSGLTTAETPFLSLSCRQNDGGGKSTTRQPKDDVTLPTAEWRVAVSKAISYVDCD